MKIYFATTNPGKVQSLQRDLEKFNIQIIRKPIDLIEPRSSDVQKIATVKINSAYQQIKQPTIVIDAGFYIHSLNGFPRAYVNFALDTIGIDGILALTAGKSRACEFRECLAYLDDTLKQPVCFISYVKGILSDKPKGKMQKHLWSKLGLIFIPEESQKTLAEMTYKEYLEWRKIAREKNSLGNKLYTWLAENKKI